MGAFWNTCPDCGKAYMWFSFTPETVARGKRCDECWHEHVQPKANEGAREE